jgi:hypothetical protein
MDALCGAGAHWMISCGVGEHAPTYGDDALRSFDPVAASQVFWCRRMGG